MSQNQPIPRTFEAGQLLFKEGDPSKSMFLVKAGTVAIRKRKGSASIELAKIYSNEVLGELSFFDRRPRSASAIALTKVQALEIEFDSLDKIYERVPAYMKTIIASLAERLRKANDVIRRLQKDTIAERSGVEAGDDDSDKDSASAILKMTSDIDIPGSADGAGDGSDEKA